MYFNSIQTLLKEGALKEAGSLIEGAFPIPVEVTAPKATFRKEGDRSATVVADVKKGAVLLAHASAGGWLKVSTPKGELAQELHDGLMGKDTHHSCELILAHNTRKFHSC